MKRTLLLALAALAAGCSTTGKFENRLACTVGEPRQLLGASMYYNLGFVSVFADGDAKAICKEAR